jgi:PAS domain S-box-containing protein
LAADLDAPGMARETVTHLSNGFDSRFMADAHLLITEVVTNAVRHGGGGQIDVGFWVEEGKLDVVVTDGGPGFTPRQRVDDDLRPGGMGLGIVDALAEHWGSSTEGPGQVWFQVAMHPEEPVTVTPEQAGSGLLDIRSIVNSVTQHALVSLDTSGCVSAWSPGAEHLTGYGAEEFLGRPLCDLYAPPSTRALERQLQQATAGDTREDKRWMRRKAGTSPAAYAASRASSRIRRSSAGSTRTATASSSACGISRSPTS